MKLAKPNKACSGCGVGGGLNRQVTHPAPLTPAVRRRRSEMIKKYGQVVVSESDVFVTDFGFDGMDSEAAFIEAVLWAISRLTRVAGEWAISEHGEVR